MTPKDTASPACLPIGMAIDPTPARFPGQTTLKGRLVTLTPLDPKRHGDALYAGVCGKEREHLWLYLSAAPFPDRVSFDAYLERASTSRDPLCFAICDNTSGLAAGYASYMRIEPGHRVIEVGSILFTQRLQRTAGATEAMYVMARHAFEDLGYRRYEWKCNSLNEASRRAALRLGFTFEGIFRQHMIVKGRTRDTAWFAMLDSEWPSRKAALERWLAPSNFDAEGQQKVSLSTLREEVAGGRP